MQMPATSPRSDEISGELKQFGFKFTGSTTVYSYLQAVSVVNDHLIACAFKDTEPQSGGV